MSHRKYCLTCQPHYLGNAGIWTRDCDKCKRPPDGVSGEVWDVIRTLRELRQHKGITQAQLARLLGVSRGTIANRETGYTAITIDELIKTAKAMHFKVHINFEG